MLNYRSCGYFHNLLHVLIPFLAHNSTLVVTHLWHLDDSLNDLGLRHVAYSLLDNRLWHFYVLVHGDVRLHSLSPFHPCMLVADESRLVNTLPDNHLARNERHWVVYRRRHASHRRWHPSAEVFNEATHRRIHEAAGWYHPAARHHANARPERIASHSSSRHPSTHRHRKTTSLIRWCICTLTSHCLQNLGFIVPFFCQGRVGIHLTMRSRSSAKGI
mmetsp:Transcript_56253/g.89284  ORF Transcript_56253/g.89284 Transcript_56253/m.89284 type:complete len:217 (-) Transcript_56253:65-715(-)